MSGRRRLREIGLAAAIVLCTTTASVLAPHLIPLFGSAEQSLVDLRVARMSPPEPQHAEIVLVVVTEDTLAGLPYRSPLDRGLLADVLQRLDDAGVAAVGVDMLFDQATEAGKDARLREVLRQLRVPSVVAWADAADGLTERQSGFLERYVEDLTPGAVTLLTDPRDGIVRWIYPGRDTAQGRVLGFPAAMAAALGREVPDGAERIAFRQPPSPDTPAFRRYPAHAVPLLPKAWFENRIVLIGTDLPHADRHRTPAAAVDGSALGTLPGVAVHAHALAQIVDGRAAPSIGLGTEISTATLAAVAALLLGALNLPLLLHTALGAACFAGLWLAGFAIFEYARMLVPLVSPSLAFGLTFAAGNAFWRGRARRQSRFIRAAFARFTSPAVVQQLIRDPDRLRLGGERREITCLFTDVAGFTAWTERSDPEQALRCLNAYLDGMCRIAFEHDGTINKIVGDALFVLFGAPVDQADHPRRAVRYAIAMDNFARAYAATQQAEGIPFGATRIGVHTGEAVVGNFGGERFFDYTAYGDTVNTAARLEGANKYVGTLVCVGGATAERCPDVRFRPVGSIVVVGRSVPIDVFEPLADDVPADSVVRYERAFARMRERDPLAHDEFVDMMTDDPNDPLVRFHALRLSTGETGATLHLTGK